MKNNGKTATLSLAGKQIATRKTQGIKHPVTEPYHIKQAVAKRRVINYEHKIK